MNEISISGFYSSGWQDYLVFIPDKEIYTEGNTFADAIAMKQRKIQKLLIFQKEY